MVLIKNKSRKDNCYTSKLEVQYPITVKINQKYQAIKKEIE